MVLASMQNNTVLFGRVKLAVPAMRRVQAVLAPLSRTERTPLEVKET